MGAVSTAADSWWGKLIIPVVASTILAAGATFFAGTVQLARVEERQKIDMAALRTELALTTAAQSQRILQVEAGQERNRARLDTITDRLGANESRSSATLATMEAMSSRLERIERMLERAINDKQANAQRPAR